MARCIASAKAMRRRGVSASILPAPRPPESSARIMRCRYASRRRSRDEGMLSLRRFATAAAARHAMANVAAMAVSMSAAVFTPRPIYSFPPLSCAANGSCRGGMSDIGRLRSRAGSARSVPSAATIPRIRRVADVGRIVCGV